MYDVIVVGARCAGSPTAMLLARKGYRVLLVDRAAFPSDTMSSHYIHQPGVARLKRWGLLDRVASSNCPAITTFLFDVGPFALRGTQPPVDGVAEAYCVRRTVLDKILVDAAVEAGAELRERFVVEEILRDGDRVTGIRGRAAGGSSVTEEARIVVGADGLHSLVARSVEAPAYQEQPTIAFSYYSYWRGVPMDGTEWYDREHRFAIAFPTNDGLVCVAIQWPIQEFHTFRANVEGNFLATLDLAPGLAERVRSGARMERFVGTADMPNFLRQPFGPGWALVGDAGYNKDPVTGEGISDAFRDAELLAAAIDDGFTERLRLDLALARYERTRNEAVMPVYGLTCQLAAHEPPAPEMQQLFASLRGNQTEAECFWGTVSGATPIPEFFARENVGRIVGTASVGAGREPTAQPAQT